MRTMPAGQFKAKCLAVIDEVNQTGEPVVITKRGKPVARVMPHTTTPQQKTDVDSIFGALRDMVIIKEDDDLVSPIIPTEEWDHLKEDWNPFPPK